jgi:hypothetical protein
MQLWPAARTRQVQGMGTGFEFQYDRNERAGGEGARGLHEHSAETQVESHAADALVIAFK